MSEHILGIATADSEIIRGAQSNEQSEHWMF